MRRSVSFVLADPSEFSAAMRAEGIRRLTVTGDGDFRARVVRISLQRLALSAIYANFGFVAFLQVPADRILVALAGRLGRPLIWGGTCAGQDRLVALGPGERIHVRTDGPRSWGIIWLPLVEFTHYAAALTGKKVTAPGSLAIHQLTHQQARGLHELHAAATKPKINSSASILEPEATHGLEQQLIQELVAGLATPPMNISESSPPLLIDLAARFQEFILSERNKTLRVSQISRALGVSTKLLQQSCTSQLGMGPMTYLKLCGRDRDPRSPDGSDDKFEPTRPFADRIG